MSSAEPALTSLNMHCHRYCEIVEASREAAELALELYSDAVRWLLLVGGGYECQEAEGTFMVAFSSADVAIEWCLMVQQVLRDMSWPARYELVLCWLCGSCCDTCARSAGCSSWVPCAAVCEAQTSGVTQLCVVMLSGAAHRAAGPLQRA